ncbi:MAG: hypothetical protein KJ904_06900 [Alphaproteobacteria bacterium]|nr:hypothetical protein [Alphaproteobacteria bacterium]MBU0797356.1 hypothetical protein [Alphaproteobacteria bacterium]MBU0886876.1 hypothetical protein [Alphaproteobacteria bacterium]MBU1812381.1 hypothetical protein [Alphaproteobacteria bacterium]
MVKALALAALLTTAPLAAAWSASPVQALPDSLPKVEVDDREIDLSPGALVALGLGAVGGSVLFNSVFGVPHAISAVAGGVLGYWWYQEYQEEKSRRTLQLRVPGSFAMEHAPQNPAVTARWLGTVSQ